MVRSTCVVRQWLTLTAVAVGAACSGSDAGGVSTPPAPPIERLVLTISPKHDSLLLGTTRALSATVTTASGVPRNVPIDFTSLSPQVATVSNGSVTALAAGEARIVARAGSAVDTATLVVTRPNVDLLLSPSAVAASLGDTITFQASIIGPSGASTQLENVTWTISDTAAGQLVGNGAVSTNAVGELVVMAQANGVSAAAAVSVTAPPVASTVIAPSNLALAVGATAQLRTESRDSRGRMIRNLTATWSSNKPSVATVSSEGVVRAVAPGGAVITATAGGRTGTAAINVSAAPATSVNLTLANDSLATGRSMQATATPFDGEGNPITGRPLAWQSSNPSVATINSSGLIVAIAAGQTTISVICDGKVSSQRLTVAVPAPRTVTIVPATATLLVGATSRLSAEVRDQFGVVLGGQNVTWSSTATSVASVNSTGLVTGVTLGSATVRATSGSLVGTSAVTVQNVPVATVTLTPPSPQIEIGETLRLSATPRDSAGNVLTNRPIAWAVSSGAIASVSASGDVQGLAVGTTTVTATVEGTSVRTTLIVTEPAPPPVALVTVTLNSAYLNVGQATTAKARAFDGNGVELVDRTVTFESDDPATATVSSDGRVKALRTGAATISAIVEDASGIATVSVLPSAPLPVDTVLVMSSKTALVVGDSTMLNVQLQDSTGAVITGRTISFTTSNPSVATVGTSGLVRAVGAGSVTITATSETASSGLRFNVTNVPSALPAPVAKVTVSLAASTLYVGQTTQGSVTLRDSANNVLTGRTLAWSSSNTSVATVTQSGLVTATGAGSVTISVQSEGKTGGASLSAAAVPVAAVKTVSVSINPSSVTVGNSAVVTAVAKDSTGAVLTGRSVTWTLSSGAAVATLSGGSTSTTTATGMQAGGATVVATVGGVTASAAFTVTAAPPPATSIAQPALPALLSFTYPKVTGKSWSVKAGDNLQTILNSAQRGDEIVIEAGATFTGNYTLPAKSGSAANGWIVIRSDKSAQLPPQGTRVTSAQASLMPKILTPNQSAALMTAPSASGYWISGIEVSVVPSWAPQQFGIINLGDGGAKQNSLSLVPSDLVLDRVYVHGAATTNTSRCISLNSARTQISDSYIHECHGKGFDSQAIAGWNGPGPFKIINNTLAGAGENVMFGGSDPSIPNLIPSDVEIRNNYLYTPPSWKGVWTKKNLLETKNVQRMLVEGNVLDGSWTDGQIGIGVALKSANQSGRCTWCASRDITFRYNIVRNIAQPFGLSGQEGANPNPVGERLSRVLIEQNVVENVNVGIFTGDGRLMLIMHGVHDLMVRRNTMTSNGPQPTFITLAAPPSVYNGAFEDNIFSRGSYGLMGESGAGIGTPALKNIVGFSAFTNNAIVGQAQTQAYPPTTSWVNSLSSAQAVPNVGANTAMVNAKTAGVIIP